MDMFIISLIVIYLYLFIKFKKPLQVLQQNFYNENNRYIKWIFHNKEKVFGSYDIVFLIVLIIGLFNGRLLSIFIGLFYFIIMLITYKLSKKEQVKLPLKMTNRVYRLIITTLFIYTILVMFICLNFDINNLILYYFIIGIAIYLVWFVLYIANIINKPIEKFVFLCYKNKATSKLKQLTNLEVIGITGSYGKTSSKNILNEILNVKYNSITTPKSFNTQYGLIITINNSIDKFNDYFIAEMGAFKRGRIVKLCNLVKPKYGIITTIGEAHLETFGSRENIQKGKFELIESLPKDGVGVLNFDDEYQTSYEIKNRCQILWISTKNKNVDVYADDIKIDNDKMTFKCYFKGDKKGYLFETKLLGIANVYNILASLALGKHLNMSVSELQRGVKKIKTIEHRLELKKVGTLNIIDDAYNSNPVGSQMALDVLKLMPGKKIIVTPGMIELGDKQEKLNHLFGNNIAKVCDEVILVGKVQTKPIYDGLIAEKYNKEKIHIVNDVKKAFEVINDIKDKKTYVLLENDLPDTFNEK